MKKKILLFSAFGILIGIAALSVYHAFYEKRENFYLFPVFREDIILLNIVVSLLLSLPIVVSLLVVIHVFLSLRSKKQRIIIAVVTLFVLPIPLLLFQFGQMFWKDSSWCSKTNDPTSYGILDSKMDQLKINDMPISEWMGQYTPTEIHEYRYYYMSGVFCLAYQIELTETEYAEFCSAVFACDKYVLAETADAGEYEYVFELTEEEKENPSYVSYWDCFRISMDDDAHVIYCIFDGTFSF